MTPDPIRRRRRHSAEFKSQLVTACRQSGVSVSGTALAHGVNANLLRRWMQQAQAGAHPRALVPVRVEVPRSSGTEETIALTVRRTGLQVDLRWPLSDAEGCVRLLGLLLT
ncbi:MAG: transposase [Acidiferrobacterales bacterium]